MLASVVTNVGDDGRKKQFRASTFLSQVFFVSAFEMQHFFTFSRSLNSVSHEE